MAMGEKPTKIKTQGEVEYRCNGEQHEGGIDHGNYYTNAEMLEQPEKYIEGRWFDPHQITSKKIHGEIIEKADFRNLLDGRDLLLKNNKTGKNLELVSNAGKENRTMGIDFTLSPPKIFTLMWLAADDEGKRRLEKMHTDAVYKCVERSSEELIITRRGAGGAREESAHGACAMLLHRTARPVNGIPDPQIHSHIIWSGMVRAADGKMLALQEQKMMNWRSSSTEIYHAELAMSLKKEGAEIVVEKGKTAFRIEGQERFQSACEAISRRSEQIKANIHKEHGDIERKDLTRGEERFAVSHERSSKVILARETLEENWEKSVNETGTTLDDVREWTQQMFAAKKELPPFSITTKQIAELREQIAEELHEQDSSFKEGVLHGKVAFYLQGQCGRDDIDYVFAQVKGGLHDLGVNDQNERVYASETQVLLEQRMVEQAKVVTPNHVLDRNYIEALIAKRQTPELLAADKALSKGQANAGFEVLCGNLSARRVSIVEAPAGAGKTFLADLIVDAWEGQKGPDGKKRSVTGLCIGWKQAATLGADAHLEHAKAITGWINDVEKGRVKINSSSLILIDEGGLVDARNMARIIAAADKADAKIIMMGDTRQLNPIGGAAMSTLAREIQSVRFHNSAPEIRRQKDPVLAQAGLDIAKGNAKEAVAIYRERGHFVISKNRDASMNALVAAVRSDKRKYPDKSQIVIANTRADVRKLNEKLREMKKETGEITGEDFKVRCGDGEKYSYPAALALGETVQFRKNQKGIAVWNRDAGKIFKIDTIKGDDGKPTPVFHVKLENGKETSFSATADCPIYDPKKGFALEQCHASTVFSSQGATLDRAYVFDAANLDRRLAYVAMTRFRGSDKEGDGVKVFLDRQTSHEKIVIGEKWKSAAAITNDEIYENVSRRWTRSEEKLSTFDLRKKSSYDLSKSDEEKDVSIDTIRHENERIVASAQLAHDANRDYSAFLAREEAIRLIHKPTQEASNDLIFDHAKELNHEQFRAAKRTAIYQSDLVETGRESTTSTLASVRELSSIGLVFEQSRDEVLLHSNELDIVGQESHADPAMRRTGASDPRHESKGVEAAPLAAAAPDFSTVSIYVPPSGRPDLVAQLGTSPLIIAASRESAETIATHELASNAPATVAVVENQNDVSLQYPAIREAIQSPNQVIVFAGDVDEKTREAVMRIAAESEVEKAEHDYRDLVHARGERDINQPEH